MNLYDAGRFFYGAARFLNTLEAVRTNLHVPPKISKKHQADLLIGSAKQGSWWVDVAATALPTMAETMIAVPFEAMAVYAWKLLLNDRSDAEDLAVELSKQETLRQESQVRLEEQRTEQLRIMASVAENGHATTQQTITILEHAVKNNIRLYNGTKNVSTNDIQLMFNEARAKQKRNIFLQPYSSEFKKIDAEKENLLIDQLRTSIQDMSKPLGSSATELHIGIANDNEKAPPLASVNRKIAEDITNLITDENLTSIYVKMKSYDWDNHFGKIRFAELQKPLSFSIYSKVLSTVDPILRSMKPGQEFEITGYIVRNKRGTPKRIIINSANTIEAD